MTTLGEIVQGARARFEAADTKPAEPARTAQDVGPAGEALRLKLQLDTAEKMVRWLLSSRLSLGEDPSATADGLRGALGEARDVALVAMQRVLPPHEAALFYEITAETEDRLINQALDNVLTTRAMVEAATAVLH